jgi:tripartite-type tricarboxylate transporter receptor subunit TctC
MSRVKARRTFSAMCRTLIAVAAAAGLAGGAQAQSFPNAPLRMLVGFAPGGSTDIAARLLAEKMSAGLGQTVLVENRPGASGQIALDAGAKAAPDGYTLNFVNGSAVSILHLLQKVNFDTTRDFTAVSTVAKFPLVLVAAPQLGVSDLAGLRRKLLAEPDKHSYGSVGTGANGHTSIAYIANLIGAKVTHVPYKGSALALADLLAGRIALQADVMPVLGPHLASGKVIGIAVLDTERVPGLNVPTIAEAGMPEFMKLDWTAWFIVIVPKATPVPVVERLNREMNAALRNPDLVKRFTELGMTPTPRSLADSQAFLDTQVRNWPPLFQQLGVKAE